MEIKYQTRLVAFIDVMGFKNLLQDVPVLNRYFKICKEHLGHKSDAWIKYQPRADLQAIMISDSIILSILLDGSDDLKLTADFINTVGLLQYILAVRACMWTRGAISVGQVCINRSENILVGQGYVDAFNLEALADYPRVIVDPKVATHLKLIPNQFVKKSNQWNYEGQLLEFHSGFRLGSGQFPFDAVQIDWFRFAFVKDHDLKQFFGDLKERMGIDQEIFVKARKLARYLRESYDVQIAGGKVKESERTRFINQQLEELGF